MYNEQAMRVFLLLISVAVLVSGVSSDAAAQAHRRQAVSFNSLQQPPADTADARRLRIWLGIDRTSACRVTVDIADSSGYVIRHLLSRLLSTGYYNIYWDKRDDSGHYVAPGRYAVHINDCGKESTAEVEAAYRPFEDLTELAVETSGPDSRIVLELASDPVPVTLRVFTQADEEVARVVTDTVLAPGRHILPAIVDNVISQGRYRLRLYINEGFVRETEFIYSQP